MAYGHPRPSGAEGRRWLQSTNIRRVTTLLQGNNQIATVRNMILLCLMWYIWLERNGRSLKDREHSLDDLKCFFFHTLFLWASMIVLNGTGSHDFLVYISSSYLVTRCYPCIIPMYLDFTYLLDQSNLILLIKKRTRVLVYQNFRPSFEIIEWA